jgi:hypothetical protein
MWFLLKDGNQPVHLEIPVESTVQDVKILLKSHFQKYNSIDLDEITLNNLNPWDIIDPTLGTPQTPLKVNVIKEKRFNDNLVNTFIEDRMFNNPIEIEQIINSTGLKKLDLHLTGVILKSLMAGFYITMAGCFTSS